MIYTISIPIGRGGAAATLFPVNQFYALSTTLTQYESTPG
jgi:hypothetical protein